MGLLFKNGTIITDSSIVLVEFQRMMTFESPLYPA